MTPEKLTANLLRAYYNARQHKRNTRSQLLFEYDLEHNLNTLALEIINHTYKVMPSSCFIVKHPVKREVFAANFRDRIVHHFIFNSIAPLIEQILIDDCYSCRKGKGTLYGINRLHKHIRSCSENFTKNAYILKLDIQGYFMNINRYHLYNVIIKILEKFANRLAPNKLKWRETIDYPLITELLKEIIYTDPTQDCIFRSPMRDWKDLPKNKSLFGTPPEFGLPIGNLTSQLFSNIYLADFDNFCKHTLRLKHYGRYVDDFYVVHTDKEYLKFLVDTFRQELKDNFQLDLHPKKIYLQNIYNGLTFLGAKIKGPSIMPGERVKKGLRKTIAKYNTTNNCSPKILEKFTEQTNSYVGGIIHFNSFKFRKHYLQKIHPKTQHIITINPLKYNKITTKHTSKPCAPDTLEAIFNT